MSNLQFEAPQVEDLQDLLPAYEVIDFIAKGGMGAVYRARQLSLDREVAIKILPREFGENDEFRKSFEAEARAMAKLNHPNLIGVYDCGEVEGMPYIVMEYVKGKALYYSSRGICIDPIEAVNLTLGICKGLAHAHEADILHRDIKPANVLLDFDKQPKVGDFGLAHAIGSDEGGMLMFGTPGYSAPEVLNQSGKVAKQSDVYSIGILFYELLMGKIPDEEYIPVTQKAGVDPRYDQLIRRALDPNPDHRFSDAGAMATEVGKLLKSAPVVIPGNASPLLNPSKPKPATQWPLWRNLAIIAILFAAIYFTIRGFQQKQNEITQEEPTTNEPELPPTEPKVTEVPDRDKPAPDPPKPPAEKPLEVLDRLQKQLASGKRTTFPPQTFERNDLRYFLVETPMTWQDAEAFAEKHGGHLPSLRNDQEASWLAEKIPAETTTWLGGGPVGNDSWGWVDGSDWTLSKPKSAIGMAAALSPQGVLQPKSTSIRYPFIIQWHMDGTNPGSLKDQLLRTKASLEQNNPSFPPGTFSQGSRNYLVIARPVNWEFASAVATLSGGHLAVPADKAENDFLQKSLSTILGVRKTCWIGSQSDGTSFTWTTSEQWNFAAWAPGFPKANAPTGSGVRILTDPGGGWQHFAPRGRSGTNALVIEWSDDHTSPNPNGVANFAEGLKKLQSKVKTAITHHRKNHEENISKNTKNLLFELKAWSKRQLSGEANRWAPTIQSVVACVNAEGRLIIPAKPVPLPPTLHNLVGKCINKQVSLDKEISTKLETFRSAYLKELNEARKKPSETGLKSQVQTIDKEIAACGNLDAFLKHFGIEKSSKPAKPDAQTPFADWLKTVAFQLSDGTILFVEGKSLRQKLANGRLIDFEKTIERIDAEKQTLYWASAGKKASLTIAPDRKTGAWTTIHRKKHQLTVVPKK